MRQIEDFENELKSLNYHLLSFESRYRSSGDLKDNEQIEKIKKYILGIESELKKLKK